MKRTASAVVDLTEDVPVAKRQQESKSEDRDALSLKAKKFVVRFNEMILSLREHLIKADDDFLECEQKNFEEGVNYIRIKALVAYYQNVVAQIRTKFDHYNRTRLCMFKSAGMAGLATLELADMVQRMEVELASGALFPDDEGYEWRKPNKCFAREQWKWMHHVALQHLDTIMCCWREQVDPFEIAGVPDPDEVESGDSEDSGEVIFCDDDGNTIPDEEVDYYPGDMVMPPVGK